MSASDTRTAILNVPHHESERSAAILLKHLGYEVLGVSNSLRSHLRSVIPHRQRFKTILPKRADVDDFKRCDLYVGTRPGYLSSLRERKPCMEGRLLWYEIIGGYPGVPCKTRHKYRPLRVPCPYIGANKWYADDGPYNVSGPRYVLWPPLHNMPRYSQAERVSGNYAAPVCLVNRVRKWGHGMVVPRLATHGVRFYGQHNRKIHNSPGYLQPGKVARVLSKALCYVHVKSKDCPGYSLYQALASSCPVVISSSFLAKTGYTDMYEDNVTCLVAQDYPNKPLGDRRRLFAESYIDCIERLRDPQENRRIGQGGRERLLALMWNPDRDLGSLRSLLYG